MPQHKQPSSLYWLCVPDVCRMIREACDKIYETSGIQRAGELDLFDNRIDTTNAIQQVQQHFINPLPYGLRETICNKRHHKDYTDDYNNKSVFKLLLFLTTVMHKDLTRFEIHSLSLSSSQLSSIKESFWQAQLRDMSKLRLLHLSNVLTDGILKVIGESCPLLEEIWVISKSRNLSAEFNFNALKMGYHVTDAGLMHLTNCQKLKRIWIGAGRMQSKQITPRGIIKLMQSIPNLKSMNYPYMESVLQTLSADGCTKKYKIVALKIDRCNLSHVQFVVEHFPNLVQLHMDLGLAKDLPTESHHKETEAILKAIASSSLKLSHLSLGNFQTTPETLLSFLSVKGYHLTELVLGETVCELDARALISIGKACPYLRHLAAKNVETGQSCDRIPSGIYSHLKHLTLVSKNSYDVSTILSILLHGENLDVMKIDVFHSLSNINIFFLNFFKDNQLPKLRRIIFAGSTLISQATVENFYNNCPNLTGIMCEEGVIQLTKPSFLTDLKEEILSKNYNFELLMFA
ncbi:uncharacterized protein LOC132200822 [Neocloeon triangulifer]|uniref:uncharacterized protein LOC132200822 n=1 Tax=Neocloeon triangulifer TaxID=2078957 RepID=UPI00286F4D3A|nr:uncharacterized protein LOC132200822 [Neocloeon triangulifer]XP_059482552.1 uncharacterized protein LOC132200822 [Neocloeon triangulifer]